MTTTSTRTRVPDDAKLVEWITHFCILELLDKGPKDGHAGDVFTTEDPAEIQFRTDTPRQRDYFRSRSVSNKLYWSATVQAGWESKVLKRGLALVGPGMRVVLYAKRLQTTHWETFQVRALRRTQRFDATIEDGWVVRMHGIDAYHTDRKLAIRALKKKVAQAMAEQLNGNIALT